MESGRPPLTPFAYRRKDTGRWCVRYIDAEGARRTKTCDPSVASREAALESLAEFLEEFAIADVRKVRRPLPPPVTIEQAAREHPSTAREMRGNSLHQIKIHERGLRELQEHAGIANLADLAASHVADYVDSLRKKKVPYDTRRHLVLWVRRACTMGPRHGIPNQLVGYRLDKRDISARPKQSDTLDLAAVCAALQASLGMDDPRLPAMIGLMALCGLSPTETIRLNVADLAGGILRVGNQGAKNEHRRRWLPMPGVVHRLCSPLVGRSPASPLFTLGRTPASTARITPKRFRSVLKRVLGKTPPKVLRKSFSSIATWELGIDTRFVEAFMGRKVTGISDTTDQHYLALAAVNTLRPAADKIDRAVTTQVTSLAEPSDYSI